MRTSFIKFLAKVIVWRRVASKKLATFVANFIVARNQSKIEKNKCVSVFSSIKKWFVTAISFIKKAVSTAIRAIKEFIAKVRLKMFPPEDPAVKRLHRSKFRIPRRYFYPFVIVISLLVILVGIGLALVIKASIMRSNKLYNKIVDQYITEATVNDDVADNPQKPKTIFDINAKNGNAQGEESPSNNSMAASGEAEAFLNKMDIDWDDVISVDIMKLRDQYPDVRGWLYFENEKISYPIMYSGDNETYLKHSCTGSYSREGAIFIEGKNRPYFKDPYTILYGQDVDKNVMFGKLHHYIDDPGYYKNHEYIQIITTDDIGRVVKYRYRLYAYELADADTPVFNVCDGDNQREILEIFQYINENSLINVGAAITINDHVLTLSTCSSDNDRIIVSFICIDGSGEL